jgi:hypothetical protein
MLIGDTRKTRAVFMKSMARERMRRRKFGGS